MANLITLSRLMLLAAVVAMTYTLPQAWQLATVVLIILTFVTDAVDGYVARRRNEASRFGAMFDIASDRIVEWTLWIVFADLGLVPVWVLLAFVVRGVIVDAIRSSQSADKRKDPFSTVSTKLGKWLVAGKFMRISYAVLKAVTFCWLMLTFSMPAAAPSFWAGWSAGMIFASQLLVYASVFVCIARGLPVIAEFVYAERHSLLGSLARPSERQAN